MTDSREKTAVLVAGMHRSGTSALAHALSLAGCDMPESLMRRNDMEGRRRGYSESWIITRLNMEILSSVNHCGFEEAAAFCSVVGPDSPFRERAMAALQDEFGDSRLFVLKDPRLCLLLRFWIDAMVAFGARPVVICPIRNPLEVVRSLKSRKRIESRSTEYHFLLWLRHVLDAEAASRHVPRAFTRYGDLLQDPLAVLGQVEAALDVSWPGMSSEKAQEDLRTFVSPTHRHHELTRDDLRSGPRGGQTVTRVFEILDRWVDGDVRPADKTMLDTIKASIDEATAPLADAIIYRERKLTASFHNSSSWRIAAPLRAVKLLLSKKLG